MKVDVKEFGAVEEIEELEEIIQLLKGVSVAGKDKEKVSEAVERLQRLIRQNQVFADMEMEAEEVVE